MYLHSWCRRQSTTTRNRCNSFSSCPTYSETRRYWVDATRTNTIPTTISSSRSSAVWLACRSSTRVQPRPVHVAALQDLGDREIPLIEQKMISVFQGWNRRYSQGLFVRTPTSSSSFSRTNSIHRTLGVQKRRLHHSSVLWTRQAVVVHISRVQGIQISYREFSFLS